MRLGGERAFARDDGESGGLVKRSKRTRNRRDIVAVTLPTPDQLRAVADYCGLALTDEDVTSFRGLMQGSVDAYNAVAAMPDEVPVVKYPRTPGYRPGPEETREMPGTARPPSRAPRAAS